MALARGNATQPLSCDANLVATTIRALRTILVKLVFIEAPAFSRHLGQYLSDSEFSELQILLLRNPEAGAVVAGTGGLRKLRWGDSRRGVGKRGGLRIWYRHLPENGELWFFTLYDKGEVRDLTPREKALLRVAVDSELSQRRKPP